MVRKYFLFLAIGLSALICAASIAGLGLFETQLKKSGFRLEESINSMLTRGFLQKTRPIIDELELKLPGKSEAEQRTILESILPELTRDVPPDAVVAVVSRTDRTVLFEHRKFSGDISKETEMIIRHAVSGAQPPYSGDGAPWHVQSLPIGDTGLYYGEALNLAPLTEVLSPLIFFFRSFGFGVIITTVLLLVFIQLMTWTLMKKATALEKENQARAAEITQSNLLLNVEVEIRKTIEQELKEANLELARLSSTDQLTGIANRRMFDQTLEKEWPRHLRDQQPLSLIICDVDFFKRYNDTYGHQKGDEALKKVAAVLHSACRRPADLAARFGGEEFCVILPETDMEGAKVLAHNIQKTLSKENIEHSASQAADHLTLSIGTATMVPSVADKSESLLHEADLALYAAKERGRNRIEQR